MHLKNNCTYINYFKTDKIKDTLYNLLLDKVNPNTALSSHFDFYQLMIFFLQLHPVMYVLYSKIAIHFLHGLFL